MVLRTTIYDAKNPPPEWVLKISGLMKVERRVASEDVVAVFVIEFFYLHIISTYEEIMQNVRSCLCKCSFLSVSFLFNVRLCSFLFVLRCKRKQKETKRTDDALNPVRKHTRPNSKTGQSLSGFADVALRSTAEVLLRLQDYRKGCYLPFLRTSA